jgi:purine-nucleoside phosphorylase
MSVNCKPAEEYLRRTISKEYHTGIILGTGLGGLVKDIDITNTFEYSDIPECPVSTVESHSGKLIFGKLSGKPVVVMQGRFHYYEGYSHQQVTFPVLMLKAMGVKNLIVSNACGALNPGFRKTDLMIMSSHINFHFATPLRGIKIHSAEQADNIYSKKLIELAEEIALENRIPVQKGVYVTVQGANLETPAEYRMLRKAGADVVGMSTVPEAIIASRLGIDVLGLSIITDEGFPDTLKAALLEEIIAAANIAEPKMTMLVKKLVEKI